MQNISINFQVPQGWHEFGNKQLRYVYQFFAQFTNEHSGILCRLLRSGVLPCHIQHPLTVPWTFCLSKESRHNVSWDATILKRWWVASPTTSTMKPLDASCLCGITTWAQTAMRSAASDLWLSPPQRAFASFWNDLISIRRFSIPKGKALTVLFGYYFPVSTSRWTNSFYNPFSFQWCNYSVKCPAGYINFIGKFF